MRGEGMGSGICKDESIFLGSTVHFCRLLYTSFSIRLRRSRAPATHTERERE